MTGSWRIVRVLVVLLTSSALAFAAAQGTWSSARWSDSATGSELAAIETPIEFGPDGRGLFACEAEGAGGLTFALQSAAFADVPTGEVTMNYRMDTDPEVLAFASWTRSADGTVVRFAGTAEEMAALVEEMTGAVSPAFFWVSGPVPANESEMEAAQGEGRVAVAVLESQGFADALATLPCAP